MQLEIVENCNSLEIYEIENVKYLHPHNHFALRDSLHHVDKSLGNLLKTFDGMFIGLQQMGRLEIPT